MRNKTNLSTETLSPHSAGRKISSLLHDALPKAGSFDDPPRPTLDTGNTGILDELMAQGYKVEIRSTSSSPC